MNANRLLLLREIVDVYCENYRKRVSIIYGENLKSTRIFQVCGTYIATVTY
jgi:hypothetical protein